MGFPFVAGMVMLMGLQFNGSVLVDMSLFVSLMGVWMFVLVRMRVRVLMGVGMPVLLLPVLMGMLMFMPVSVLMFMGVVVFAFHRSYLLSSNDIQGNFCSIQSCYRPIIAQYSNRQCYTAFLPERGLPLLFSYE